MNSILTHLKGKNKMESKSRHAKFLDSLKSIGCDVNKLNSLSETHELPPKLLQFISGGKTGFTRSTNNEESGFRKTQFYRAMHH